MEFASSGVDSLRDAAIFQGGVAKPARDVEVEAEKPKADEVKAKQADAASADPAAPSQLIAIRIGLPDLNPVTPDQHVRQALDERSGIRRLNVIDDPTQASKDPTVPKVELIGSSNEKAPVTNTTTETDNARKQQVQKIMGERSTEPTPGTEVSAKAAEDPGAALAELSRDTAHAGTDPVQTADVAAVAPQAAATQPTNSESETRVELPGHSNEEQSKEVAKASFSQGGGVEAATSTELASKFVSDLPAPDPGPTPRTSEDLGERSKPVNRTAEYQDLDA